MYTIRSTYDEWAPEFDEHPDGRQWCTFAVLDNYEEAWAAVILYLLRRHRWRQVGDLSEAGGWAEAAMPYGHTEPTARYGDTTIRNDAEIITITEQP